MPSLTAASAPHPKTGWLTVAGEGWSDAKIRLTIRGKSFTKLRATTGTISRARVLPANGAFQLEASLPAKLSGSVQIEAREVGGEQRTVTVAIELPPAAFEPNEQRDDPSGRLEHFNRLRGR